MKRFDAVFFDLDGTLVDSAPDLAAAANAQLQRHGRPTVPFEALRAVAGSGARGMLGVGFGLSPGDDGYPAFRDEFLAAYQARLLQASVVFEQAATLLDALDQAACPWGVVTNKALCMADPLLSGLGLRHRAAVLVGGDSTPHLKPHPASLLLAARTLNVDPTRCVYVGDDERDAQAGRAAGMATVAAAWGYLGRGAVVEHWGVDHIAPSPIALLNWLNLP
jgi:N-acetyl-D-muramate 6-phosphate phosphatase